MTSQPASITSLKRLMKQVPTSSELKTLLLDLNREKGERAWAITFAALLDAALEMAISTKLALGISDTDRADLFGARGILSSFSAKIEIAFVFGLIGPETRGDLDCIREIRNAFAHAKGIISFDTKEIAAVCSRLKFPARNLFSSYQQPAAAVDKYQITATFLILIFRSLPTLAKDPQNAPKWLPFIQK